MITYEPAPYVRFEEAVKNAFSMAVTCEDFVVLKLSDGRELSVTSRSNPRYLIDEYGISEEATSPNKPEQLSLPL